MGRPRIVKSEDERALVAGRTHAGKRKGAPQKRRAEHRAFTREQKERFLAVLAETSNVAEACRTVGKSLTTVYRVRHTDPVFGEAWMKALEQGFAALEMEALRRARFGQDVTEYRVVVDAAADEEAGESGEQAFREQAVKRVHSYDGRLTVWLLTHYADKLERYRAAQGRKTSDGSRALEAIRRKLLAMKARGEEAG
jgi:hypothetical protein